MTQDLINIDETLAKMARAGVNLTINKSVPLCEQRRRIRLYCDKFRITPVYREAA